MFWSRPRTKLFDKLETLLPILDFGLTPLLLCWFPKVENPCSDLVSTSDFAALSLRLAPTLPWDESKNFVLSNISTSKYGSVSFTFAAFYALSAFKTLRTLESLCGLGDWRLLSSAEALSNMESLAASLITPLNCFWCCSTRHFLSWKSCPRCIVEARLTVVYILSIYIIIVWINKSFYSYIS